MTDGKLTRAFEVRSYEADPRGLMRADCVQNKLQELAYEGSQSFGAGYSVLREKGCFWVLNRMHFRLLRSPRWGEGVEAQTWSRGMVGPLYHRNFLWTSTANEPILAATSAWTVVHLESRSIVRDNVLEGGVHLAEDTFTEGGAPQFCGKVAAPRELELRPAGTHRATWTDLDTNGHVNNCSYLRWAIDLPSLDYMASHTLCDVQIAYFREIHAGEEVQFLLGRRTENLPAWEHGLTGFGPAGAPSPVPGETADAPISKADSITSDDGEHPSSVEPVATQPWKQDQTGEAWYLDGRVGDALSFSIRLFFTENK